MVPEVPIGWLLDSDPSLRWQVDLDLAGAPPPVWEVTRARIATEGFGARLLALQDPDVQWAGGAYFLRATSSAKSPQAARRTQRPPGHSIPCATPAWIRPSCGSGERPNWSQRTAAGSTRICLLGWRSRLLHQRFHARQRIVARCRCGRHRDVVRRTPASRRWVELRMGRRCDAVLGAFDGELVERPTRLRRCDRRHSADPCGTGGRRGIPVGTQAVSQTLDG